MLPIMTEILIAVYGYYLMTFPPTRHRSFPAFFFMFLFHLLSRIIDEIASPFTKTLEAVFLRLIINS